MPFWELFRPPTIEPKFYEPRWAERIDPLMEATIGFLRGIYSDPSLSPMMRTMLGLYLLNFMAPWMMPIFAYPQQGQSPFAQLIQGLLGLGGLPAESIIGRLLFPPRQQGQ